MANQSTANVEISAEKVGKELVAYIRATNNTPTDYAIVYSTPEEARVDENGDITISDGSSGRWQYSRNLEGYFDSGSVKEWLGVDEDYSWLQDESAKSKYKEDGKKSYAAYLELVKAIKEKDGRIDINYTDCDPAMDWMGDGSASLELMDGEVVYSHTFEEKDLDITEYANQNDMSIFDAMDMLHGEEPAIGYNDYVDKCKKEGSKPKDPQAWYDEDFEWEE